MKHEASQSGFTLVELAIVMIIIGLLIGGILKGQELVSNARVTSTVSQIKGLDGAISTFRDKYAVLPGDMLNPGARLPSCTAAPCTQAGDQNGRIDTPPLGTFPNPTQEGSVAFTHMSRANLIEGLSDPNAGSVIVNNNLLMPAKVGGRFWLGYTASGNAPSVPGPGAQNMRVGHYLVLSEFSVIANAPGIEPIIGAQIDRKLDDGVPITGDVRVEGTNCIDNGQYNESGTNATCSLFLRVQS
jgi:prepilin-type N-terminal cleavage/methylation domain-containing protein